jgi:hypothetical protein
MRFSYAGRRSKRMRALPTSYNTNSQTGEQMKGEAPGGSEMLSLLPSRPLRDKRPHFFVVRHHIALLTTLWRQSLLMAKWLLSAH